MVTRHYVAWVIWRDASFKHKHRILGQFTVKREAERLALKSLKTAPEGAFCGYDTITTRR